MDQHPLPRPDRGQVTEGVQGGEEDQRHRGSVLHGPAFGDLGDVVLVGDDDGAESAGHGAEDAVAGGEAGDGLADGGDHAGGLGAHGARLARVHAERVQHVAEVETGRLDVDADLVGAEWLEDLRARGEDQVVQAALAGGVQAPRGAGGGEEAGCRGEPFEPADQRGALADGELGVAAAQQTRQVGQERAQGVRGVRSVEVQQNEAVRVLGLGGAHQAPGGTGREVADGLGVVGGDRSRGDEDQAGVGEPVGCLPLLEQVERPRGQRVDGGGHVGAVGVRVLGAGRVTGPGERDEDEVGCCGRVGVGAGQVGEGGQGGAHAKHVVAEGRRGQALGGLDRGCGRPVQAEDRLLAAGGDRGAGHRGGAQDQGLCAEHRDALGVDGGQPDRLVPEPGDPHPQRGGAPGVQGDAVPGEGQQRVVLAADPEVAVGVLDGVKERGVHAEVLGVPGDLLGEGDLHEGLLATEPHLAQALEGRPVPGTAVVAVELHGDRVGRGPDGCFEGVGALLHGQEPVGVPGPRRVHGVGGPRVEGDRPGAGVVGSADGDLDGDRVLLVEDHRRGEDEFLDAGAADLVGGADGHLQVAGARHDDGAADAVVEQPGVDLHRDLAGEQDALGAGERDGRAEQGVFGGDEAGRADVAGEGGRARPVPLPLEGVGGQLGAAGAGAGEPGGPVHPDTADVEPGDRAEQRGLLVAVLAQGREDDRLVPVVGFEDALSQGGEDAAGADLQEGVGAGAGEGADAVGEADGGTDVLDPVRGVGELSGFGEGAGDVGDHRDTRLGVLQALRHLPERVEHRLHQRGVEGVADRQALGLAAFGRERLREGEGFVLGAGDHHGVGAVHGRQGQAVGEPGHHLGLGRPHGHHRPAGGEFLHQTGAGGDQRARVLQREDSRHVGRRDLADRVARDVAGTHAPRLDEAVQGDLDGEQRGLRVPGRVQESRRLGALLREQHLPQ